MNHLAASIVFRLNNFMVAWLFSGLKINRICFKLFEIETWRFGEKFRKGRAIPLFTMNFSTESKLSFFRTAVPRTEHKQKKTKQSKTNQNHYQCPLS